MFCFELLASGLKFLLQPLSLDNLFLMVRLINRNEAFLLPSFGRLYFDIALFGHLGFLFCSGCRRNQPPCFVSLLCVGVEMFGARVRLACLTAQRHLENGQKGASLGWLSPLLFSSVSACCMNRR